VNAGSVEALFVAAAPGARPEALPEAVAVAGRGLEGDRYFGGAGTFFREGKEGQDLTLIEAEALEELAAAQGIELDPGDARRNVVTRGAALDGLLGRRFTVGEVECVGVRSCDPCSHLERETAPGVLKGLAGRGGLRADIVSGGTIRVGDPVRDLGEPG
jgi:MOSC domain-containing protein YiiM